ncbi:MAG: bifunctional DNA-formamidopyrimidine glycosylase/DNA-(apurinic or apyrimidinic site) lyase [Rhodospirillales bacterium]|nr:bifunctional DNA-formamidopyrimidine glycosylase/DNA-(apurinic or apyrimidinic site) lyase [Rhodospirillales bacterium]
MPELPEVETVRRAVVRALSGRRLSRVHVRRRDLRVPLPRDFARRLEGRRVLKIARRAKFLLVHLDGGEVLVAHLGMSGRMRLFRKPAPKAERHDHVEIAAGARVLRFNDPRRFGLMALVRKDKLAGHKWFRSLGPEPLGAGFTGRLLAGRLKGRRTSLKAALMDQRIVAGLGNIYVSEAMFRARLSPRRRAGSVQGALAGRLARAVKSVLRAAIAAGGSTLRDHRRPSGELGYFQHRFAVYDREGKPCPGCTCDVEKTGGVKRLVQGGRATFYCPRKQR